MEREIKVKKVVKKKRGKNTFDVSTEHPEAICMDQEKPERCD